MNGLENDLFLGSWSTSKIQNFKKHSGTTYISILLLGILVQFYVGYIGLTLFYSIKRIKEKLLGKNVIKISPNQIVH